MITKNIETLKIHKLSKAQYDRELDAGRIDESAIYLIDEEDFYANSHLPLTGGTITGSLILSNMTDTEVEENNDVALIIGNRTGQHLEFDSNQIMAKSNGTTAGSLYLNTGGGGSVIVGSGGLDVTGVVTTKNIQSLTSDLNVSAVGGNLVLGTDGYFTSSDDYKNKYISFVDMNRNPVLNIGYDSTSQYYKFHNLINRTSSSAANVVCGNTGVLSKATSASKYKLNIEAIEDDTYAYNVLKLTPKTWHDKAAVEAYADYMTDLVESGDDEETVRARHVAYEDANLDRVHGLIAEDVRDAGLDKYCSYSRDPETEEEELDGIQYDRIPTLLIPVVRDLVLFTQKVAPHIDLSGMNEETRDELSVLLNRINSFKESEIIA